MPEQNGSERAPMDHETISTLYYRVIEYATRIKDSRCIYCGEPARFCYDGYTVFPCCRNCYVTYYDDDFEAALIDTEVL